MSGHFYCENCEGNAGGSTCVACGRPAVWQAAPEPPKAADRKPRRVTLEEGLAKFAEIRRQLSHL